MGFIVLGKMVFVCVLVDCFLVDLVSVDFVLVYCGLDIGSVKFDVVMLVCYLYVLIDICDFVEFYLVVDFCVDVFEVMCVIIR